MTPPVAPLPYYESPEDDFDVSPARSGMSVNERLSRLEALEEERDRKQDRQHEENQQALGELRDSIQMVVSNANLVTETLARRVAALEKQADRWEGRGEGAAWASRIGWAVIVATATLFGFLAHMFFGK